MSNKPPSSSTIVTFLFVPTSTNLNIKPRIYCAPFGDGDPDAIAELRKHHPAKPPSMWTRSLAKLADAQFVLARSYGLPSWPRLVTACRMTDAIWRGDVEAVRKLVTKNPKLLHEAARGIADSNWGPPMSYAANVGQDAIIQMLRGMGADRFAARLRSRLSARPDRNRSQAATPWARARLPAA